MCYANSQGEEAQALWDEYFGSIEEEEHDMVGRESLSVYLWIKNYVKFLCYFFVAVLCERTVILYINCRGEIAC